MEKSAFRVLVVEDIKEVRADIEELISKQGYQVSGVGSTKELFCAILETSFNVIFLDILLESSLTIQETQELFDKTFPGTIIRQKEILTDFGLRTDNVVNGRYLLPLIKAARPNIEVVMLSNAIGQSLSEIEDVHYLDKYGANITLHKYSEDVPHSRMNPSALASLDEEVGPLLRKLFENTLKSGGSLV